MQQLLAQYYYLRYIICSSREALADSTAAEDLVENSLKLQNDTIELLQSKAEEHRNQTEENTEALESATQQISDLRLAALEGINQKVGKQCTSAQNVPLLSALLGLNFIV